MPYETTSFGLHKSISGRVLLTSSKNSQQSIFDFDSVRDAEQELFMMADAAKRNQAHYYLCKKGDRNVLL